MRDVFFLGTAIVFSCNAKIGQAEADTAARGYQTPGL
jgi:hypothetical protein